MQCWYGTVLLYMQSQLHLSKYFGRESIGLKSSVIRTEAITKDNRNYIDPILTYPIFFHYIVWTEINPYFKGWAYIFTGTYQSMWQGKQMVWYGSSRGSSNVIFIGDLNHTNNS